MTYALDIREAAQVNGCIGLVPALPARDRTRARYERLVWEAMHGDVAFRAMRKGHNVILDQGITNWARALRAAAEGSKPYRGATALRGWALGTGTTAAARDDTALETEVIGNSREDEMFNGYQVEDVAVFAFWVPEERGNGNAFAEAALETSYALVREAGVLALSEAFNRWTFAALPSKTTSDILVGMVTIRFNPANTNGFTWTPWGKRFVISKLVDVSTYGQLDEYGTGSSSAEPSDDDQLASEQHTAAAICAFSAHTQEMTVVPVVRPTGTDTGGTLVEYGARTNADDKYLYRTTFDDIAPGGADPIVIVDEWGLFDRIAGKVSLSGSSGPLFAGTAGESSGKGDNWSDESFSTALDGRQTTISLVSGNDTEDLIHSNFGFSVPGGDAIGNIVVEVLRKASLDAGHSEGIVDQRAEISTDTGSTSALTNEARTTNDDVWPDRWEWAVYTFDGSSLTPAEVNATSFSFRFSVDNIHSSSTIDVSIEAIRVTVYHS